jgi:hypothetical protein
MLPPVSSKCEHAENDRARMRKFNSNRTQSRLIELENPPNRRKEHG